MAKFIIMTEANANLVAGQPDENGQRQGDRFNNDPDMVYGDDSELNPIRRAGGGTNPDPCYILNILVLDPENGSNFQVAWDYLGALPTKDYSDPTFPAPYTP
jgi:hypothetical protein